MSVDSGEGLKWVLPSAQDEFEVVDDLPPAQTVQPVPVLPPAQLPSSVPQSILQRNRMASQRGAVNIALLKRGEGSRAEIREAFLSVHGAEETRSAPLRQLQQQFQQNDAAIPPEKLEWLKDVLARRARNG